MYLRLLKPSQRTLYKALMKKLLVALLESLKLTDQYPHGRKHSYQRDGLSLILQTPVKIKQAIFSAFI